MVAEGGGGNENFVRKGVMSKVGPNPLSFAKPVQESLMKFPFTNVGITIPAGTTIEISPYIIHRDPDFFPEPDQFRPDRFIESTHHPYAFVPFGGGPRL